MTRHLRLPMALLTLLALAACGEEGEDGIREDATLREFRSCGELEEHIETEAIKDMNARIDSLLEGRSGGGVSLPVTGLPIPAPTRSEAATDFTTTNTQEKGVDEADFVKNDGRRAFVLHDRQLLKLHTWPPEETRLEWSLPVEGYPTEMFLEGNRVVVFSRVNLGSAYAGQAMTTSITLPCALTRDPRCADGLKVTVVDVAGASPVPIYELYLDSSYLSARRTASTVRVVTTGGLRGPQLVFYLDEYPTNPAALRQAYDRLRARNAALIRAASLEDWMPRNLEVVGGRSRALSTECGFVHASTAPASLGLTTVSALDLSRLDAGVLMSSVLSPSSEVYASAQSLYVATPHYWRPGVRDAPPHVYIHKFDTASDRLRVRYVASGGVPGQLVDQFSMGEHNGYLRVATTQDLLGSTTNGVHILQAQGGRLQQVGALAGLAPGERLFSSRFLGDRGYLVTFRQVDPLFTLDLRDPRQPRLAGELKVPGFSTYLHPMDADHLLAIGRETTELPGGAVRLAGLALQVFDVSDFATPRLQHKEVVGTWSSSSDAERDHKAFNYFGAKGLLAIPFSDWTPGRTGGFRSSLELFRVTVPGGIVPVGSVDHTDLARPDEYRGYPWPYSPVVRRSILMEAFVYSISMGGLKVSPADNPGRAIVAVPFPGPASVQ